MPLQLDVEAVGEHPVHLGERRAALLDLARGEQRIHRPVRPAGEQDQALGVRRHLLPGDMRLLAGFGLQVGGRRKLGQVEVAAFALRQEDDGRGPRPALGRALADAAHRQGAAHDRLHAHALGGHRELQRPEQVGPVG
jgi:hypothetical protein